VVLAFCDSQPDLVESDEQRVVFANHFLEDLRFLYRDADGKGKKVCPMLIALIVVHVTNNSQKWKGLFRGPFVLQVFAAHLSAIDSSVRVPNLHDGKPTPDAIGALGLAAASVCALYRVCRTFLITNRWSEH